MKDLLVLICFALIDAECICRLINLLIFLLVMGMSMQRLYINAVRTQQEDLALSGPNRLVPTLNLSRPGGEQSGKPFQI